VERIAQEECAEELRWVGRAAKGGFRWLGADFRRDGLTGYDAVGWPAWAWIVNAMHETDSLPEGLTHDEVRRIEEGAGVEEPAVFGAVDLSALLRDATLTGAGLGWSSHPGAEWHRVRWSELAARHELELFRPNVPPSHLSFPFKSWPVNIEPPTEGSLDVEQFSRLVDRLAEFSAAGATTQCFAYYSPLGTNEFDDVTLFRCDLGELRHVWENDEYEGSPSNIWPDDRSWFVYTDWDLTGTKISGTEELISSIETDDELEAVRLPF
jgi:hypothetical protein